LESSYEQVESGNYWQDAGCEEMAMAGSGFVEVKNTATLGTVTIDKNSGIKRFASPIGLPSKLKRLSASEEQIACNFEVDRRLFDSPNASQSKARESSKESTGFSVSTVITNGQLERSCKPLETGNYCWQDVGCEEDLELVDHNGNRIQKSTEKAPCTDSLVSEKVNRFDDSHFGLLNFVAGSGCVVVKDTATFGTVTIEKMEISDKDSGTEQFADSSMSLPSKSKNSASEGQIVCNFEVDGDGRLSPNLRFEYVENFSTGTICCSDSNKSIKKELKILNERARDEILCNFSEVRSQFNEIPIVHHEIRIIITEYERP
jgi:hypothetical protein